MPENLSRDELEAYFALVSAGDLVQRAVAHQLAEHGLTPLQFSVLAALLDSEDGLRMSDLADAVVVSRSGMTYQVTQLEKAGLVERISSPTSSRGVVACLTPAGRALIGETLPGHISLVRENLIDILAPDEVQVLRTMLEKVVGQLRAPGTTRTSNKRTASAIPLFTSS